MTTKLRKPGEYPVLVPDAPAEPVVLKQGYGMCDTVGHHGYCWIVEPREVLNGVTHGKCASCKRKAEDAGA